MSRLCLLVLVLNALMEISLESENTVFKFLRRIVWCGPGLSFTALRCLQLNNREKFFGHLAIKNCDKKFRLESVLRVETRVVLLDEKHLNTQTDSIRAYVFVR